jgi:DNA-binding transcriptional regulator YhcF (GntR family)
MVVMMINWEAIIAGYNKIGTHTPTVADLRLADPDRQLSRAEQIADRLADGVLSNEIPEGTWLRETQVAERFNVSRGPIREAFRLLEGDGILILHANRGAMVTPLASADLWQIGYIYEALTLPSNRILVEHMNERVSGHYLAAAQRIADNAHRSSGLHLALDMAQFSLWSHRAGVGRRMEDIVRMLFRQTLRYTAEGLQDPALRVTAANALFSCAQQIVAGNAELSTNTYLEAMRRVHREGWERHRSENSAAAAA